MQLGIAASEFLEHPLRQPAGREFSKLSGSSRCERQMTGTVEHGSCRKVVEQDRGRLGVSGRGGRAPEFSITFSDDESES
jgi:hypothetical protein